MGNGKCFLEWAPQIKPHPDHSQCNPSTIYQQSCDIALAQPVDYFQSYIIPPDLCCVEKHSLFRRTELLIQDLSLPLETSSTLEIFASPKIYQCMVRIIRSTSLSLLQRKICRQLSSQARGTSRELLASLQQLFRTSALCQLL